MVVMKNCTWFNKKKNVLQKYEHKIHAIILGFKLSLPIQK